MNDMSRRDLLKTAAISTVASLIPSGICLAQQPRLAFDLRSINGKPLIRLKEEDRMSDAEYHQVESVFDNNMNIGETSLSFLKPKFAIRHTSDFGQGISQEKCDLFATGLRGDLTEFCRFTFSAFVNVFVLEVRVGREFDLKINGQQHFVSYCLGRAIVYDCLVASESKADEMQKKAMVCISFKEIPRTSQPISVS